MILMTCQEVIDYLMKYLNHELPDDERAEFERHLAVCPPCVDYLETYQQTIRLGKAAYARPDEPACDEIPEDLLAAILAARPR